MESVKFKKIAPAGQAYCEKCDKPVMEWTITTLLIDGVFLDVCRSCKNELKPKNKVNGD